MKTKREVISKEQFDKELKKLTWKKFFTYKAMELGIIPLAGLAIWKIPSLIGKLVLPLISDPEDFINKSSFFCYHINHDINNACVGNPDPVAVWFIGFTTLVLL